MNLLVTSLKAQIEDLARAKGVARPRVLDKVNARGEIVIALILPGDLGGPDTASAREERKKARER